MAMYTLKGIGEISTDAFDEKITLRNLLQHFSFYDFIFVLFSLGGNITGSSHTMFSIL